ncbi:M3 family oligoendopeptidase [Terrihabitans rhizophilus]|uniref:M3 family oligoendopeptidase n=1 Tax=Terrihabitans rhizophilus TaxID=3092662 RepID=A0ABU4RPZ7_9HYPH|nr:M3 family oligoendopeptidase [Terrihabitans sp. PJ23]MDX6806681.1 M3 family oligoendopeptidase [Terrihabitans sp. PJ23]
MVCNHTDPPRFAVNLPSALFDAAEPAIADPKLGSLPEWNLADLYTAMDAPELVADLARAADDSRSFEGRYKGRLSELAANGGQALLEAVRAYEAIDDLMGRLGSYAGLVYAGNTNDPARAKFYGDVSEKLTDASAHLIFFTLELNGIDDAVLDAALSDGDIARYRPFFEDVRKERPHQLEPQVEQLFHENYTTGRGAWNRLFDETIAGLEFDVRGEKLPLERTLNLMQETDETLRKDASEALAAVFKQNLRTFTLITNTLAKDKEISDRWRKFEDIADSRHLANRVEREVVEALVQAVQDAYPRLSHRYYKLKAKWFGKEVLEHWDRNAPLPSVEQRTISWEEARGTVLSAYGEFAPKMADIAQKFFDKNWIDAPARPGKAPGAFAHPTTPSAHPYVLVNYLGKPRDVMTLAHELGHGVHQVLAAHNGPLMAPTPLTLAETASVFGEMLTFRKILEGTTDPVHKKALLASKVEDMLNTVVRQIAFYTFERRVHTARREEGELTSDRLNEIWMSVQGESLGPAIRFNPGYEVFWTYIGHFIHSPFYVYAYAFGDCLVNSLYAVYENAHDGFADRYFELLAAGGTKHHSELLAPFGLDARDPAFWQTGLGLIERMISDLEELEQA